MSHVVSSSAPIASAHTVKQYAGFGILGADIPTTGDNGGSPVLNDSPISTSEYHWRVETAPSAGVLTIYPDLTFAYTHSADISTSFTYRLYEDGVDVGTATVALQIGAAGGAAASIAATTADAVGGLSAAAAAAVTVAASTASAVGSFAARSVATAVISAATAHATGSVSAVSAASAVIAAGTAPAVGSLAFAAQQPQQIARPVSDGAAGGWVPSSGAGLYAMLDEPVADDADYVTTGAPSAFEVALGTLNDPGVDTGHIVRYRLSASAGGLTVSLLQGASTLATWAHAPAPAIPTTYEQTLTAPQAASITYPAALKLRFEATP